MLLRRWTRRDASHNVDTETTHDSVKDEVQMSNEPTFATDRPWVPGEPDRLGRRHFAKRVARTIADNPSDNGLVLGVYGPWGEGKTSLLQMIADELAVGGATETLWFNPWYFRDQDALVMSFLGELASKLEVRLGTHADEFKRVLNKYGQVLSALPLGLYGADPGKLMSAVADRIKGSDLEALKKQLDAVLEKHGVSLVVFMDDIDRLDRTEIHAVLKLVKLVAGFRRVTYVLAFDDEMVAAAVGDSYGKDAAAGRNFLDKIVQVPLRLPCVDSATLLHLTLEEVDRALVSAQIDISTDQAREFRRFFDELFHGRPRTLRAGKRYGNSLAFALPLLKGEASVRDLLLLEAMRVLVPDVYAALPLRRELLLGDRTRAGWGDTKQQKEQAIADWTALLDKASPEERSSVEGLLEHLFPRVKRLTQNMHYGEDWAIRWAHEQRVASPDYFDRFFLYGVRANDVPDLAMQELLQALAAGDIELSEQRFNGLLTAGNAELLIRKLRYREDNLAPTQAATLIRLLGRRAAALPNPRSMWGFGVPKQQAIFLLTAALRRVPVTERSALVAAVVSSPTPLAFSADCFRRIRYNAAESGTPRPRLLTTEDEKAAELILAHRLSETAAVRPFYLDDGDDAALLLHMWRSFAGPEQTAAVLVRRLQENPSEAGHLIAALAGQPWNMETGLPLAPALDRSHYDAIGRLVDPSIVVDALHRAHGEKADAAIAYEANGDLEIDGPEEPLPEIRLAQRFTSLHRAVLGPAGHPPAAMGEPEVAPENAVPSPEAESEAAGDRGASDGANQTDSEEESGRE